MNIGVIFAGGTGSRMHDRERPKQFLEMFHKPVIIYTLEHFEENALIDAVVIACLKEWIPYLESLLETFHITKVKKVVPGGETGQLSIYHGLCAARELAGGEDAVVLIHDGVRPLISAELLTRNIESVREYGSAITAGTVTETAAIIDERGMVRQVPSRASSRVAKAPQSFWLKDILSAHETAMAAGEFHCIDSCTLMHGMGYPLRMIDGPHENIKITTPEDFYVMRAILQAKENEPMYGLQ